MKSESTTDGGAPLQRLFDQCLEASFEKDRLSHLGRLVRGLIHNVNGPLQNVSMLTEMLLKGQDQLDQMARTQPVEDPGGWEKALGKQRQRMERLTQQIANLAGILRDFMVLLEIERNESEVDLRLLLCKLVRVLQSDLFLKHEVEVELNLAEEIPLVRILGRDLVPSFMHLFHNCLCALKHSTRKKLTVDCFLEGDLIKILFLDTGCGVDPRKDQDPYFELFFSDWPPLSAAKENDDKHFGFGLFCVRRLLSPYGVSIRLEPNDPGTRVELSIPVQT